MQEKTAGTYEFTKNYLFASSSSDGAVKMWNMYSGEQTLQFAVPKERCSAMALHQFHPYLILAFTDGYLRFFEITKSRNLGRCQVSTEDHIVELRVLPSGKHILCATALGLVLLIFVDRWDPLAIRIDQVASLNASVCRFELSFVEPYNKWLVGTRNGRVLVYNRREFNALN